MQLLILRSFAILPRSRRVRTTTQVYQPLGHCESLLRLEVNNFPGRRAQNSKVSDNSNVKIALILVRLIFRIHLRRLSAGETARHPLHWVIATDFAARGM